MKKLTAYIILLLMIVYSGEYVYPQSMHGKSNMEVVESNDTANVLDSVTVCRPIFSTLPDGKRLKIRVINEDATTLKKAVFYIFYKNKKVCKLRLPDLKTTESYEFCTNIHEQITRRDRKDLLFKIKKRKAYRTYKLITKDN